METKSSGAETVDVIIEADPSAPCAEFQDGQEPDWLQAEGFSNLKSLSLVDEKRQNPQLSSERNCLRLAFIEVERIINGIGSLDTQPLRRSCDLQANGNRSFRTGEFRRDRTGDIYFGKEPGQWIHGVDQNKVIER